MHRPRCLAEAYWLFSLIFLARSEPVFLFFFYFSFFFCKSLSGFEYFEFYVVKKCHRFRSVQGLRKRKGKKINPQKKQ